jgi:hypothetical protein
MMDWLRRVADVDPEQVARQVRDHLPDTDAEKVARQVRDQVREYIELNRRRFEPARPDPTPAVIAFGGGLALGIVAMYLLDPDEGPARRSRLKEMFQKVGSRGSLIDGEDTAYSTENPVYGSASYGTAQVTEEQAVGAASDAGSVEEEEVRPGSI